MLHATVHAINHPASAGPPYTGDDGAMNTLAISTSQLQPLDVTFDSAAAALEALPRMYFEPDGSFVWVSSAGEAAWQLEGQLQDRGERLDHVEIKGTCAPDAFAALMAALRGGSQALVFQLVRAAVVVDEGTALRLLSPLT